MQQKTMKKRICTTLFCCYVNIRGYLILNFVSPSHSALEGTTESRANGSHNCSAAIAISSLFEVVNRTGLAGNHLL